MPVSRSQSIPKPWWLGLGSTIKRWPRSTDLSLEEAFMPQQLYKLQQTFVVLPDHPMVNSSTSTILSCEKVTFDPLESRTSLMLISLRLPMAVNFTFTGKKTPGSEGGAPETLNSSEFDVSEDDIRGTVQTSEWPVRLYDWESELTFAREFGLYMGDRQPVGEEIAKRRDLRDGNFDAQVIYRDILLF